MNLKNANAMAVPSSGTLSLLGLAREKQNDSYTDTTVMVGQNNQSPGAISLESCATSGNNRSGQVVMEATNTNSPSYPNSATPHRMSEFYSYDHDAVTTYTAYRTIHYAKPLAACNPGVTSVQTWTTASFANGVTVYTNSSLSATLAAGNYGYHTSNNTSPTSRYTTNSSGVVSGLTTC